MSSTTLRATEHHHFKQQAQAKLSSTVVHITTSNHITADAVKPELQAGLQNEHQPNKKPVMCRTPHLRTGNPAQLRQTIRDYFIESFNTYESLFECLASDQGFYQKSIRLRHPLIFYYGHTATFFVNKLLLANLLTSRINPHFESIFAVGVDEMSWDDLDDTHYDWPTPQAVKHYRDQVRAAVLNVIDHATLDGVIDWQHPWWAILMGIEHERIHLETSSVLIRQHDLSLVRPMPQWRPNTLQGAAPLNQLNSVAAARMHRNKDFSDPYYGWDNEFGQHEAHVDGFLASQFLVSNQEFLQFVQDGGYQQPHFWTEEGQNWLKFSQAQHPTFWLKRGQQHGQKWHLRLMTEEIDMPWNWPVEVNYLEAKAFCNWKAAKSQLPIRLPTEDEWSVLYQNSTLAASEPTHEHAHQHIHKHRPEQTSENANLHLNYGASPCPVDYFNHGDFFDVMGNVWQWTETPIYPFEGFNVHPIYDDFTTPTFDQKHNLMKGGSWISCGNESLPSSRYAFRRHFFQHAGFRYISSNAPVTIPESQYETDRLMSEYAEFHYGEHYFGVENFSKALVNLAMAQLAKELPNVALDHALDLGCASGRASFELAQHFNAVTGIDFSARFIQQAVQLTNGETLRYTLCDQGELVQYKSCNLTALGLQDVQHKVSFYQGDACNLKQVHSGYDFILAANLIDRLYDPKKFLSTVHERLNMGGVLMISSPYTWLNEHTPRENWLGGFKQSGENFTTLDGLHAVLEQHFQRIGQPHDVPFVIRETKRKYQHSVAEVTFWQRIK